MPGASEEISRAFYARLGADGLASRTRAAWDHDVVSTLVAMLPAGCHVLDLGCGYGRITLPLAEAGYRTEGIDLSPTLVEAARRGAEDRGLDTRFAVASMTALPCDDESFDAVLCLWSAFHELLDEDEQAHAIREVWRVLSPGGFALVEGPVYVEPTPEDFALGRRRGPGGRISWDIVEDIPNPHFLHDRHTFAHLCEAAGIDSFEVAELTWGGRPRLLLTISKAR